MPKQKAAARAPANAGADADPAKTPVHAAMDAADAMFRAAVECCHQHDRASRVHEKSAVEDEVLAAQKACEECDSVLRMLMDAYEKAAGSLQPKGKDEGWWHRANGLWLASREYLRRHGGCDASSRELKEHGPERLGELQTEYELEASALLALRHAADAYKRDRPTAA
jgi:hypothetical protein